ncbi:MAG: hypothetical protein HZA01_16785 [Nitrospinae bacterium]|nr:hypothetical protein [Nitrospinota bacterium]
MRLKLESPLALSASPSGNINRTLDFLPGSALRGALASSFLDNNDLSQPKAKELFQRLFLKEEIIFENFYIDGSLPVPKTARACKGYGGFACTGNRRRKENHGVKDYLLPLYAYGKSENSGVLSDECYICRLPMERFSGYYGYNSRDGYFFQTPVPRREITRTGIHPATQTALPGVLFTVEVINEESVFDGSIKVLDHTLDEELKKYIKSNVYSILAWEKQGVWAGPGSSKRIFQAAYGRCLPWKRGLVV